MNIYHGSIEIVASPEIRIPNRHLDYGAGFYTTTSYQQAEDWARRRLNRQTQKAFVNIYELNEEVLSTFNILKFNEPTDEWLEFVMQNRTRVGFTHDYDVVYGPVANDKVYAAFALYEGGLIDKQMLIAELKTYTLVDQYLFHTEKSLQAISFLDAKEISL
jgi:hypothetical protein